MADFKSRKCKVKKGMTLVEILVALSIVVISVLALFSVFTFGITLNLHNKYKATAYHIAQQEMEIIRSNSFYDLTNQDKGNFIGTVSGLDKLPSATAELTIEDYEGNVNIKKVVVDVSWAEKTKIRTVSLVTLVSRQGLNP